MSMKVDLRVGQSINFNGGKIVVTLLEKSGQRARFNVEADDTVKIGLPDRDEVPAKAGISGAMKQKMLAGRK